MASSRVQPPVRPGAAPSEEEVTHLVQGLVDGDSAPSDAVVSAIYRDLRKLAHTLMRRERHRQTFQTTELVHAAYLRMVDQRRATWRDRAHFMALAAMAMRRILVERARRRATTKRGAGAAHVLFDETSIETETPEPADILAIDEALSALRELSPRAAGVVELRFFAGLTVGEVARVVNLSERMVKRDWEYARAWLSHRMKGGGQ